MKINQAYLIVFYLKYFQILSLFSLGVQTDGQEAVFAK